jgi:predicted ATPase/DNA-binding SARP family transcriptional activator
MPADPLGSASEPIPSRSPWTGRSLLEPAPVELTQLVGRARELAEIVALLPSSRLVTLTGAGGSGKTRLAMELSARVREEGTSVAWAELASLDAPGQLPGRVLEAVGVRLPRSDPNPAEVARLLGEEPRLVVLDNCEHLVEACARFVDGLLRAHPALQVLATSREALGVRGERAWLVPPLSLPARVRSAEEAAEAEAVQLFVARAREARSDFRLTDDNAPLVAEICARLDGLPLAIELAAARVRVLAAEEIRDHLDDAFRLLSAGPRTAVPRHRTLQAAFEWSHALLTPENRALLERLSVFRGGFTLEAAEAVVGVAANGDGVVGSSPVAVLDGIAGLVDRSLLHMREEGGHARYLFLETVRQFAAARLKDSGEAERVRRRHAEHWLAEAEAAAPHVFGGRGTPGWMERLEREDPNLRAALEWSLNENGEGASTEIGLRLATALLWYWFAQGRFSEGRAHLERALDPVVGGAGIPAPVRARGRICLAHLAFWQGDHAAVGPPAREALVELEGVDDPVWRAMALIALGMDALLHGRPEDATAPLEEAVVLVRPLGHPVLTVFALYWQGIAAERRGDRSRARAGLEEAATLGAASGDPAAAAHPLTVLGRLLLTEGDVGRARHCLLDGLAGHRISHDRWGMVLALEGLAELTAADGGLDDAVRILAGAGALRQGMAILPTAADRSRLERMLEVARQGVGFERVEELQREGAALELDALLALAQGTPHDRELSDVDIAAVLPAVVGERGLHIRALGPLEVYVEGQILPPEALSYSRPRELLIYLLLHPRGAARDDIGRALWPEASPAQVRNSVHVTLHHLRKALGRPEWILLEGDRYRLTDRDAVTWDGHDFEQRLRAMLAAAREGPVDPTPLRALLSLCRGELLEGSPGTRWLEEARDQFRRLQADGHLLLARTLLETGDAEGAAREYEAVIRQEELNEEAHRGLMTAWAGAGHRDRALRHYQRLSVLLAEALDSQPEEETRALQRRIQAGEMGAGVGDVTPGKASP